MTRSEALRINSAITLIAELEVAKYHGCKLLSLGDACPCKICDLERRLAAREAELAGWKEEAERSHRNVAYWQGRAEQAEAELATLRGALEAIQDDALQGECDLQTVLNRTDAALATPPRRTPEGER
jgi:hypothetical protein